MFDRIAPVYDVMNHVMTAGPRPALAAGDGRGGRAAGRPRARCLLWHGRPGARRRARRRRQRRRARLLAADDRARAAEVGRRRLGRGRCALAAVRGRMRSTRQPSASEFATSPISPVRSRELARVLGQRRAARRSSRSRNRPERSPRSIACGSSASCPVLGRPLAGGSAYKYLPASVRRFPGRTIS